MRALTAQDEILLNHAREAGRMAYCAYSRFPVGAAVETDRGVFAGCNIENASYGLSICAERCALFAALAGGSALIRVLAVSCLGAQENEAPETRMPCGACRQVIAEFMAPEAEIIIDGVGAWYVSELLPQAFRLGTPPFLAKRQNH